MNNYTLRVVPGIYTQYIYIPMYFIHIIDKGTTAEFLKQQFHKGQFHNESSLKAGHVLRLYEPSAQINQEINGKKKQIRKNACMIL